MTAQEKLNALAGTDLFGAVHETALRELAETMRERRLVRGEVLFSGGDKATGMFVVVSGKLRAYRQTREGREQTIHVEGAGATLAEVPVFDGGPYPSTGQAEEDSIVLASRTHWPTRTRCVAASPGLCPVSNLFRAPDRAISYDVAVPADRRAPHL